MPKFSIRLKTRTTEVKGFVTAESEEAAVEALTQAVITPTRQKQQAAEEEQAA